MNDFELGKRHNLQEINIINDDGTTNNNAGEYAHLSIKQARERVLEDLQEQGYLEKIENYKHSLGHCYRCDTIVEPYLSQQWFVKMKDLALPAIKAVQEGRTDFVPERWSKVYFEMDVPYLKTGVSQDSYGGATESCMVLSGLLRIYRGDG